MFVYNIFNVQLTIFQSARTFFSFIVVYYDPDWRNPILSNHFPCISRIYALKNLFSETSTISLPILIFTRREVLLFAFSELLEVFSPVFFGSVSVLQEPALDF